MVDYVLEAKAREDKGKGASRRLRRLANQVPAIIYGGNKEPQNISLVHNDISHALENEGFYSHIITINVDGTSEQVILKDLQRHPAKPYVTHADFLRVDATHKLTTRVPLHFINEATSIGVKGQGGIVSHILTDLEIQCLPKDLPEYIEVDLARLELGQILHISDITLPSGIESVALSHGEDHDLPVATVIKPRAAIESEGAEEEEEGDQED